MLTALLISAATLQAAPLRPPPVPDKKIVREIIVLDGKDAKGVPPADGKGETRRIVIREGGPAAGTTEDVRIIRVNRNGKPGDHKLAMVDCDGGSAVSSDETTAAKDGKKVQTRIVICAKGDSASRVEALRKAQRRIAENKDIPPETRDRITASLEAQIATLRAAGK